MRKPPSLLDTQKKLYRESLQRKLFIRINAFERYHAAHHVIWSELQAIMKDKHGLTQGMFEVLAAAYMIGKLNDLNTFTISELKDTLLKTPKSTLKNYRTRLYNMGIFEHATGKYRWQIAPKGSRIMQSYSSLASRRLDRLANHFKLNDSKQAM